MNKTISIPVILIFFCSIFNSLYATDPIGVMPFDSDQKETGEKLGAEILVNLAKTKKFTLVERAQLKKALDEIATSQSGNISASESLKIGKMSGAKYLVIGDIHTDTQKDNKTRNTATYKANVRIVKTETGIIIGADQAAGSLDYINKALSVRVKQLLNIYMIMDNPDSPYSILLKLDKGANPVYKTGETLKLKFLVKKLDKEASNSVYIQVYSINANGAITLIYPNKFANGMEIQVGREYTFPAESDDFEWALVPPTGSEAIQAIVTEKPVHFFSESRNYQSELFPSVKKRETENTYNAIKIQIKKEKLKDWAAERITYKLIDGNP